ncbi:MAG TPA: Ser-Thr-rich GPI-anchored membrane family protein, partial [bacterium]
GSESENRGLHSLAIGNFNNDGYDDLALGTPWYERFNPGSAFARGYAFVFLSNPDGSGLDFSKYIEFLGYTPIGNFAYSMVTGDVNGDKIDDLIISARYDQGFYEGRIYIYLGGSQFDNSYERQLQPLPGGKSLFCKSSGDVNGDGFDDIVGVDRETAINSPDFRMNIWLGKNNLDSSPNFSRSIPYKAVWAIGDLNGDRYSDIILSDAFQFNPPTISPNLTIIKGDSSFAINRSLEIAFEGHHSAVSALRDINGDGLNDIFVTSYDEFDNGKIHIFAGDRSNYIHLADKLLSLVDFDPSYGLNVEDCIPADMNGDGELELYVSSQMMPFENVIFIYNANFPSLTITYPTQAGIEWKTGKDYTITWISKGGVGPFAKIELYKADLFDRSISESTDNDGSFRLTVPPDMKSGSDYKIKISSTIDSHVYDFSDHYLTIKQVPVLKITYPDTAGIAWYWGETHTILWQSWGEVGPYVKLELYKDDHFYRIINYSSLNEGFYRFAVSPMDSISGEKFKIKITSVRNDSIFDFSDASFGIFRIVSVKEKPSVIYSNKLYPNYPNPFNATTKICYEISSASDVQIRIYNLLGKVVKTLANTHQSPG